MNFDKDVIETSSKEPVIVIFSANWCPPCRMLKPVFKSVSQERGIRLVIVDVDKHRDLAIQYKVRSLPSTYMFRDGEIISAYAAGWSEFMVNGWIDQMSGVKEESKVLKS